MMKNSLDALEESLEKKIGILNRLQILCDKQTQILSTSTVELESFDECMSEQDALIEKLNQLDKNFDTLYESVKEILSGGREQYVAQIERLQQLNREIAEKSTTLQEQELCNKENVLQYIQNERKNVAAGRRTSKVAYDYYKSMSQSTVVPPHFMDKKK